jgi:hypothetical protein
MCTYLIGVVAASVDISVARTQRLASSTLPIGIVVSQSPAGLSGCLKPVTTAHHAHICQGKLLLLLSQLLLVREHPCTQECLLLNAQFEIELAALAL